MSVLYIIRTGVTIRGGPSINHFDEMAIKIKKRVGWGLVFFNRN